MASKLVTVKLKNGRVLEVPESVAEMYEMTGAQIFDPKKKPAEIGTRTIPREVTAPKTLKPIEDKAPAEITEDAYPGDPVVTKPVETVTKKDPVDEVKTTEKTPVKAAEKKTPARRSTGKKKPAVKK